MSRLKRKISSSSFWMFMIGLGGQTQVHFFGSIGISELPIFFLAPIIFFQDFHLLRRDGFLPWIWLAILTCVGCVISAWANDIYFILALKGLATPYSIFAVGVVFHRLLRKDFLSFRWFLIGYFLSGIICTFVFQPETYTMTHSGLAKGDEAFEMMITHPLYWTSRITAFLKLPINGWYLSAPHVYSWIVVLLAGVVQILFSDTSGRGAFGMAVATAGLIFLGGKSRRGIARLGKNLWILVICGLVVAVGIKTVYKQAALSGWLGEKALAKYEKQTERGDSLIKILMAGRKEFFTSMTAAIDKPILGHGSKAEDTGGYAEAFLAKYGTDEDYRAYLQSVEANYRRGITYRVIPTHSYLGSFWVYYGIIGLIYWLYVLWLMWQCFHRYASAVPQWYGYFCINFFGLIWGIFFSPYGDRLAVALPIVCALFAKAVYEHKMALPFELEMEAQRHNH